MIFVVVLVFQITYAFIRDINESKFLTYMNKVLAFDHVKISMDLGFLVSQVYQYFPTQ